LDENVAAHFSTSMKNAGRESQCPAAGGVPILGRGLGPFLFRDSGQSAGVRPAAQFSTLIFQIAD
jgi:hypothetical protein